MDRDYQGLRGHATHVSSSDTENSDRPGGGGSADGLSPALIPRVNRRSVRRERMDYPCPARDHSKKLRCKFVGRKEDTARHVFDTHQRIHMPGDLFKCLDLFQCGGCSQIYKTKVDAETCPECSDSSEITSP
jgi:hypothetical protein